MIQFYRKGISGITLTIGLVFFSFLLTASQTLSDPYEIFNNYLEAIGGAEKLVAEKSIYYEGIIIRNRQEGIIKEWSMDPHNIRREITLGKLVTKEGYNGKVIWNVDRNGQVKQITDDESLKRRKVYQLMSSTQQSSDTSRQLTLSFLGLKKLDKEDCYLIQIINTINDDKIYLYINRFNFLLEQKTTEEQDFTYRTRYWDYRSVEGIKRAFRQETEVSRTKEKTTITWQKIEPNKEMSSSLFDPPTVTEQDFTFPPGVDSVRVPFILDENTIYLEADFNGKKAYWIVDSGAESTLVSRRFARKMKLKKNGRFKSFGVVKKTKSHYATLPPYRIGDIRFKEQSVIVTKLSAVRSYHKYAQTLYAGLLGYDFLSRFVTRIDFPAKEFVFYIPSRFKYTGKGKSLKAPVVGNTMTVRAGLNYEERDNWIVDTGAQISCLFYYATMEMEKQGILKDGRLERKMFIGGVNGYTKVKRLRFDSFQFAGYTLMDPFLVLVTKKTEGVMGFKQFTGIIGMDFLQNFIIYLDFGGQKMIIENY